jgi:hypothetical protein
MAFIEYRDVRGYWRASTTERLLVEYRKIKRAAQRTIGHNLIVQDESLYNIVSEHRRPLIMIRSRMLSRGGRKSGGTC